MLLLATASKTGSVPPPDTRFPVLGEEQSALSHRAVSGTVPTSHGKANACEQVQVRGRQVRGSGVVVGVVQCGAPCPAFSTSPLNSRDGAAAPGRGCGAAPRPGSSPRLGAVGMLGGFPQEELLEKGEGKKGMSFPSCSIRRSPLKLTGFPVFGN